MSKIVKKTRFNVPTYEIGLDEKLKDFEAKFLLLQYREKPQVVGIVGLAGVGKTTLAKELFRRKSSSFSRSYFLSDVQGKASRKRSSLHLLGELVHGSTGLDPPINSSPESILDSLFEEIVHGLTRLDPPPVNSSLKGILESFKEHPSLVVLDGVDDAHQLDKLLQIKNSLPSNSLIVITSRHENVLISSYEEASIYKLTRLSRHQSRKLFCFHAFRPAASPPQEYECLVDGFLTVCDGLPLSLEVLGAFLHRKNDRSYWENQLYRFQQTLPFEIDKRLKISYDALNIEEKHMFLDIACVFIGENVDTAIRIWKGSGWRALLGFQSLLEKRLVEVDSENCINMHDHLKDLGKTIAEQTKLQRPLGPLRDNNVDLLKESSVITEMRRDINDLLQRSSEARGFMLIILIILIMMMAMMIWSMARRR